MSMGSYSEERAMMSIIENYTTNELLRQKKERVWYDSNNYTNRDNYKVRPGNSVSFSTTHAPEISPLKKIDNYWDQCFLAKTEKRL